MNAVPKPASKHIVRIMEGGNVRSFAVSKDEFLIGRDERADIRVINSDVSSRHLYVKIIDGLMISLRDPGSTNGTFVGGQKLPAGKEIILESLNDEIMLGKVAKISITPAALQPAQVAVPKVSSRLALVKETPAPAPTPESVAALVVEHGTLTGLSKTEGESDRYDLPDRVVISEEASRLLLRPDTQAIEIEALSESFVETIETESEPVSEAEPEPEFAPEPPAPELSEEDAHAAQATAMAEQAAKAALVAQEAAAAAVAAHEKAKASAVVREKAKADKIKAEAEAREKAKLDAVEREKAKASAAAEAAREKSRAAQAADEAALAAKAAHEKAKEDAKAEANAREAALTTQNLNDAARAEIAAYKKKAILDIEVVQMEAISFSEVIKQEGHKDAEAIRETGRQEIVVLKDDAKHELDRIKEFALREVEALRDDARRQGDAIRDDAKREAEAAKSEGLHAAELLKTAAKKEVDTIQYEGEKLKNDVERTKAEIERLKADNDRLRADGDKLRADYRDESGKLAVLRQEADSLSKISELQKTQAETAVREMTQRRDALSLECDQTRQKVLEAATLRDSLAKERTDFELKIQDIKKTAERAATDAQAETASIKHLIERETHEHAETTARLAEIKHTLRIDEDALKTLQENTRREKDFFEADERKRKALYEALDAEYRVKRLSVDAQLGELDLKRSDVEREVHKLKNQQTDAEQHLAKLKADAEAQAAGALEQMHVIEKDAQKAREKMDRFKHEGERLHEANKEQESSLHLLRKKTEEAKKETHAAQEALLQAQNASAEARRHVEQELSQVRALIEAEAKTARDYVTAEVALMRQAAQEETHQEIARRKDALKVEFVERGKAMERELADAKLKELKIIQGLQEEEKKALRIRMETLLDDLVHKTLELAHQKPLDQSKSELRQTLKFVLEGKSSGTLSVEADERSKKFFKKIAIRAAIPAGLVLFFVIFPGVPGAIKERFSRTVASEKNDSGVFLDQIKQRGLKFQPEMDRSYRGTYCDNILYVEDYVEMKLSDKEQKEWTLVLNDFIVGRLGLSDRIIPDFISSEAVMVQDLMHIREGILPQFKDQGLTRMAEAEKIGSDKLIGLLQSPENYQRFRMFEKDYYDNYIRRAKPAK